MQLFRWELPFVCSLVRRGFVYTLKIAARILNDRVNKDRLCNTNAYQCWLVCLFVGITPEKLYSASFCWREVKTSIWLFVCMSHLFAYSLGFCRTLKITARTLSDVVTRVRLCGRYTRRSSRGVSEVQSGVVMRKRGVCLLVHWDFVAL